MMSLCNTHSNGNVIARTKTEAATSATGNSAKKDTHHTRLRHVMFSVGALRENLKLRNVRLKEISARAILLNRTS